MSLTARTLLLITLFMSMLVSGGHGQVLAAVSPTPKLTATPTASPTPALTTSELDAEQTATVNQNLKRMIDKVVEQNKEKIQARLQEIGSRRRGFIGEIKNIREGAISLRTKQGTQIIPTDQGVELLRSGKTITADKAAVGDWVVVTGVTKDDAFMAEKVEFLTRSPQPKSQIVQLGSITELKKNSLTLQSRKDTTTKTYTLNKTTQYLDSEAKKTPLTNFSTNMQILLIAQEDETGASAAIIRALAPFEKDTKASSKP